MRIAIGLEYCGEGFEGWQTQPHGRTVQDQLEPALAAIAGVPVATVCAGRTDTGVHAAVQVAHFDTEARRPLSAWVRGTNSHLPEGIAVQWAVEVDSAFSARFSARSRRYRYLLLNRPVRSALHHGRVGWFHQPLDVNLMQSAAQLLLGEQDFSTFRAATCQAHKPVRTMSHVGVQRQGDWVIFEFEANAFLHHMVRNLVGALVYVGKGSLGVEDLGALLAERNRRLAPPTFSPCGLYLAAIEYPDTWNLPNGGRIAAPLCLPLG